jgi:hypothetical protein
MEFEQFIILLLISAIVTIIISLVKSLIDSKYKTYIFEHSTSVKELTKINSEYIFRNIEGFDFEHIYNNEAFYNNISTSDYLTYQLVYVGASVKNEIKAVKDNIKLYQEYITKIQQIKNLGSFEPGNQPKNFTYLCRMERKIFSSLEKKPQTDLAIQVRLTLTNLGGRYLSSKKESFNINEIESLLIRISNKRQGFYLDEEIWQSICRVERGRVSNKMRFAVYSRDGYRCKKCGRKSDNLEVDHIFPVSKGGKSEFDNLQTLCHWCNKLKSNTVESDAVNPRAKWQGIDRKCEVCGAPMVIKKGKYGDFYG